MTDVVIVGGGIMGLLLARELVGRSIKVTLMDQSELGSEASWAGGGIVSPLYPWTYSAPVTALATWAQQAYPVLAEALLQETGIDPELNLCGLLMLDPPASDTILDWAQVNNKSVQVLDYAQATELESALDAQFQQAVWWPQLGNIRNPRLLQALQAFLENHPDCQLLPHHAVEAFEELADGGICVKAAGRDWRADQVVICAGAWAGQLLQSTGFNIAVQPVRGQMLVFEPRPGLIKGMILHKGRYLIPRKDGRILVGSTLEYTEFDKSTTEEAKAELLACAYDMVPALRDVPVEAHWAGLRPGAPEGIPYIGKIPGWNNLYMNAGHFRNGLVLAPASARLMRNLLLGETPIVDPLPYDPLTPRPSTKLH